MSALIKPGGGEAVVRAFATAPEAAAKAPARVAERDPGAEERAALRAEVARLEKLLADTNDRARREAERAREEGRRAGRKEAEDREADRLAAVADGVVSARRAFAARLELLDGLAAELARRALAKVFEPAEPMAGPVTAMLARQMRVLREASVLAIRVSGHDFADPAALAALTQRGIEASVDPELRAGAARISCRLGAIDLDLREQWGALSTLLEAMANEGAA